MIVEEPQTRAELARRRLADLMASFDAQIPPPASPTRPGSHAAESSWRVPVDHVKALVTVAVAAGILLSWWLLSARPRTSEPEAVQLSAHTSSGGGGHAAATMASNSLVIDVEGKVRRPGIVTLPRGSRVHQAITKAGGLKPGADTSTINLARVLADGEQVIVGSANDPGAGASAPAPALPGGRVSLNSATAEQLDTLPGIGPVTAAAIIAYRTEHGGFQRVEDLLDVKGIGEATLADLRSQVSP